MADPEPERMTGDASDLSPTGIASPPTDRGGSRSPRISRRPPGQLGLWRARLLLRARDCAALLASGAASGGGKGNLVTDAQHGMLSWAAAAVDLTLPPGSIRCSIAHSP